MTEISDLAHRQDKMVFRVKAFLLLVAAVWWVKGSELLTASTQDLQ